MRLNSGPVGPDLSIQFYFLNSPAKNEHIMLLGHKQRAFYSLNRASVYPHFDFHFLKFKSTSEKFFKYYNDFYRQFRSEKITFYISIRHKHLLFFILTKDFDHSSEKAIYLSNEVVFSVSGDPGLVSVLSTLHPTITVGVILNSLQRTRCEKRPSWKCILVISILWQIFAAISQRVIAVSITHLCGQEHYSFFCWAMIALYHHVPYNLTLLFNSEN